MKKMRRLAAIGAATVLAAGLLAGCGGGGSSAPETKAADNGGSAEGGGSDGAGVEKIDLVFSHINAETHTWHKMAVKFKELIEEKSGGNITVTITSLH